MKPRAWLKAAVLAAAMYSTQMQAPVAAQAGAGVVISEFRFRGTNGGNDEFIELFNASAAPVNVGGWLLRASNNTIPPTVATRATIPAGTVINPGCFYLAVNNNASASYSGAVPGNLNYGVGFADDGGVALMRADLTIVDQVGHGANGAFGEGTRLPTLTVNANRGIERRRSGAVAHVDTNNNAADFQAISPGNPQNASSACITGDNPTVSGAAFPATVEQGELLTLFATVAPATAPASTGLQVVGDLSAVGASASEAFADNGVAPDAAADDRVFTAMVTVSPTTAPGAKSLALTVTDAQARTTSTVVAITVIQPPALYLPHEIQGPGRASPLPNGTPVRVRGVVTARKFNGFFIQTEPGFEDADANTSEGLFVFVGGGGPAAAQVGRLVDVRGSVAEFISSADPGSPPLTELSVVTAVTDRGSSAVPAPYLLTVSDLSEAGALDQLERFEGMRVTAVSLTAVSGTGGNKSEANATSTSDGAFYAVLTGHDRPYREPGVEAGYPLIACTVPPCNIPVFDGNPERLRVDSDALEGMPPADLATGAVMADVTGPLDFGFRTYTILPEAPLAPVGGMTVIPARAAAANEYAIASFNMERFFDSVNDPGSDVALTPLAYQNRLAKASLAIRNVLSTPDIIGMQEVEHLAVLNDLSLRIDADATAAGTPPPAYAAYLIEGFDQGGIDVAFLVKTAGNRVTDISVEQVGGDATFVDPGDDSVDLLNDRPPLVLRATIDGGAASLPQPITVIANHLRSLIDVERDDNTGRRVRAKRQAQAEFLASYIQGRQLNDPGEAVVSLGDYNAFSFNDGYGDSMGTIRGVPVTADQAATASADLVSPDLVDVADFIPASERYSYVFGGNAQTLDHVIVTANLVPQFVDLVHPRVNADFPEVLRGNAATPARLSDHDPAVAFFTFPPDVDAPVFSTTPADQLAEATGPDGAPVAYDVPAATDNLDVIIDVTCAPASGSTFALGSTGVTCSAADLAGNVATVSFSITVQDTTAPSLTVPANLTDQAGSPAGQPVSFAASATDLVTASPVVACAPSSGTTFPLGINTVTCSATDLAGNTATGSFTITITPPVPGRMLGAGGIGTGSDRVGFEFDVRESADYVDRGTLKLKVANRPGRPDHYFAADVTDVRFSNQPGYGPGRTPGSGVDTVSFTGVGSWNGQPGYTYAVIASDRGEPGRGHDTFTVVIKDQSGVVVATAGGTLGSGNLQSLR